MARSGMSIKTPPTCKYIIARNFSAIRNPIYGFADLEVRTLLPTEDMRTTWKKQSFTEELMNDNYPSCTASLTI